jgi:hypothetical protein
MKRRPWFSILAASPGLVLVVLWLAHLGPGPLASASVPSLLPATRGMPMDVLTHTVFLPLVAGEPESDLSVDPQDRQASMNFFNQVYLASENATIDWTGSHAACDAGTTADAFRYAVQLRINYFRAMAGVPGSVQLSDEYNRKAQKAALMMSANRQLNHTPPAAWQCYSAEGAQAAGSSNLSLGIYGPAAITGYMVDPGEGNYFAGHRRWILYPQTQWMGTGDIPPAGGYPPANALWVFDENMWAPRPQTREEYVAWPPPGYVPYQVIFSRWSFAYDEADFSSATVEMSTGGQNIPLVVRPVANGYGENTLVWEPEASFDSPPAADITYSVAVYHVKIGGVFRDFFYQVIVFDPGSPEGVLSSAVEGNLGVPPKAPGTGSSPDRNFSALP